MSKSKTLFFMSGSIAAFKACQLLSRLVQEGHEVQVVATPSTFHFVGEATLEGLTGKQVCKDLWEPGRAMDHIHLSRWADRGLLCPATAGTLAKISMGLSDDLLSSMILAWPDQKPLAIVPAMNHQMYKAAPTQEHLARLQSRGFRIAPTQAGPLACGEEGVGRMLEVDQILHWLDEQNTETADTRGEILITGGATREPIDGIRFLSNVSTGKTAADLADQLRRRGWQVTYLHGTGAALPQKDVERIAFSDFQDLNGQLQSLLSSRRFEAVIHCAAVSDYSVQNARTDIKLSSEQDLKIELKRNFKILPRLREYSRHKNIQVIGFKLTLNAEQDAQREAIDKVLQDGVNAVVHNDWARLQDARALDPHRHPGQLVWADPARWRENFSNVQELSLLLDEHLQKDAQRRLI